MKNRYLKWAGALALSIGVFGCNTGNVQVGSDGASTAAPTQNQIPGQNTPPVSSQPSGDSQTQVSSTKQNDKVYFEKVLSTGGLPDQVIAISFAAEDSATTTPFGVALRSPVGFGPNAGFFPGADQIIFLESDGLFSNSLVSTSLSTMQSQSLFDFPRPTADVSLDSKQDEVAWVDSSGAVSISGFTSGETQTVGLSGDTAQTVSLSNSGNRLWVRTSSGALLTFGEEQGAWKPELDIASVSASAFSPDGSQLVYVSGHDLYVVNTGNPQAVGTLVTTLESSMIYDLAWNATDVLSYWTRLSSGNSEIRVLGLSGFRNAEAKDKAGNQVSPPERTVVQINMPLSITDGVVCPAWSGNSLYFGNYTSGEYLIQRAVFRIGAVSAPTAFAVPPASDEGFVCPKLSRWSGKR